MTNSLQIQASLAWTIGGSLVATGLWVGLQIANLNSGVEELTRKALDNKATTVEIESRVRMLEKESAQYDSRIGTLNVTMVEVRTDLREILNVMRGGGQGRSIYERIKPGELGR